MRPKTIKILEKNTVGNFFDVGHSNFFLDMSPKGRETKEKLLGLPEDKRLLHSKGTINTIKRQPTEWEKIFANDISDKGLVSKIYKELIKLKTPKMNNPIENGQKTCIDIFPKQSYTW